MCTAGSVPQLESMECSLKLYCSQLSLQCQKLLLSSGLPHHPPPSPSPSLAHCQAQIQQLEEEKSQLLEYVQCRNVVTGFDPPFSPFILLKLSLCDNIDF